MTGRNVMALALKIAGIYFLCKCVSFVAQAGYLGLSSSFAQALSAGVAFVFAIALYLATGLFLIRKGDELADHFFQKAAPTDSTWQVSKRELTELAFAVAGLIILAAAIPAIVGQCVALVIALFKVDLIVYAKSNLPGLISSILKALLGLWLLFRGRGLVRLWESTRGWSKKED